MLILIQYLVDFNSYLVDLIHFLIVLNPMSRRFLKKKNKKTRIYLYILVKYLANK